MEAENLLENYPQNLPQLMEKACDFFTETFFGNESSDFVEMCKQLETLKLMLKDLNDNSLTLDVLVVQKVLFVSLHAMTKTSHIDCVNEGASLFLTLNGFFSGLPQLINENADFLSYVKNLGETISKLGDYDSQVKVLECMQVIATPQYHSFWIRLWFSQMDDVLPAMFADIGRDFPKFSRKFLNRLNDSIDGRSVHSVTSYKVKIDDVELSPLPESFFWIDFNFIRESISFYCMVPQFFDEQEQDYWDCIKIPKSMVDSVIVKPVNIHEPEPRQAVLELNCSYLHILNNDYPEEVQAGRKITLMFWGFTSFLSDLERIFGQDIMHCPDEEQTSPEANKEEESDDRQAFSEAKRNDEAGKIQAEPDTSEEDAEGNFAQSPHGWEGFTGKSEEEASSRTSESSRARSRSSGRVCSPEEGSLHHGERRHQDNSSPVASESSLLEICLSPEKVEEVESSQLAKSSQRSVDAQRKSSYGYATFNALLTEGTSNAQQQKLNENEPNSQKIPDMESSQSETFQSGNLSQQGRRKASSGILCYNDLVTDDLQQASEGEGSFCGDTPFAEAQRRSSMAVDAELNASVQSTGRGRKSSYAVTTFQSLVTASESRNDLVKEENRDMETSDDRNGDQNVFREDLPEGVTMKRHSQGSPYIVTLQHGGFDDVTSEVIETGEKIQSPSEVADLGDFRKVDEGSKNDDLHRRLKSPSFDPEEPIFIDRSSTTLVEASHLAESSNTTGSPKQKEVTLVDPPHLSPPQDDAGVSDGIFYHQPLTGHIPDSKYRIKPIELNRFFSAEPDSDSDTNGEQGINLISDVENPSNKEEESPVVPIYPSPPSHISESNPLPEEAKRTDIDERGKEEESSGLTELPTERTALSSKRRSVRIYNPSVASMLTNSPVTTTEPTNRYGLSYIASVPTPSYSLRRNKSSATLKDNGSSDSTVRQMTESPISPITPMLTRSKTVAQRKKGKESVDSGFATASTPFQKNTFLTLPSTLRSRKTIEESVLDKDTAPTASNKEVNVQPNAEVSVVEHGEEAAVADSDQACRAAVSDEEALDEELSIIKTQSAAPRKSGRKQSKTPRQRKGSKPRRTPGISTTETEDSEVGWRKSSRGKPIATLFDTPIKSYAKSRKSSVGGKGVSANSKAITKKQPVKQSRKRRTQPIEKELDFASRLMKIMPSGGSSVERYELLNENLKPISEQHLYVLKPRAPVGVATGSSLGLASPHLPEPGYLPLDQGAGKGMTRRASRKKPKEDSVLFAFASPSQASTPVKETSLPIGRSSNARLQSVQPKQDVPYQSLIGEESNDGSLYRLEENALVFPNADQLKSGDHLRLPKKRASKPNDKDVARAKQLHLNRFFEDLPQVAQEDHEEVGNQEVPTEDALDANRDESDDDICSHCHRREYAFKNLPTVNANRPETTDDYILLKGREMLKKIRKTIRKKKNEISSYSEPEDMLDCNSVINDFSSLIDRDALKLDGSLKFYFLDTKQKMELHREKMFSTIAEACREDNITDEISFDESLDQILDAVQDNMKANKHYQSIYKDQTSNILSQYAIGVQNASLKLLNNELCYVAVADEVKLFLHCGIKKFERDLQF